MSLTAAGLIATGFSFLVLVVLAVWYVGPWMMRRPLAVALAVPLWVHGFRYVALQIFSAQHFGFGISDTLAKEIAWGDVAGALLALVALWLLRRGSRAAVLVVWVFVVATTLDLLNATVGGIRERALESAFGVTWLILNLYAPLLWITLALVVWRLVTRTRTAES
ncbi:MAG TPA: hypothetical protein VKF14_08470 [Candidatus Dormibacteraeota bacterium]|nr:hypothetical protein [Candidatus Dormibacteraeota bacterium]